MIGSKDYIDSLFKQYKENPGSVHSDWKHFFEGVEMASSLEKDSFSRKELQVFNLIQAYREDGHLKANLDPLQLQFPKLENFELSRFDLNSEDLEKNFEVFSFLDRSFNSLREVIDFLEKTYCGTLAVNVRGCDPDIRNWFFRNLEQSTFTLTSQQKKFILEKLIQSEVFEKFLHNRFLGAKRFSIEGSDALIPMLEYFIDQGANQGAEEFILGMAHRGRLNVMAHVMNQPLEMTLAQFEGEAFSNMDFTGDVKYHIGYSCHKKTFSGKSCKALLGFNPSHLESIDPIILGVTRALQRNLKNTQLRNKALPILIHGDASFCGQGVVSETLQLSQLKGYRVGGTLHIIINNQLGFTTDPKDGRSTLYSSDLAQSIQSPVLLVNGDDVEACIKAMDLAFKFRKEFNQDIVIDLISYRRFGHNEGDEPAFTQPLMYEKIKKHPVLTTIYKKQLLQEKILSEEPEATFKKYTDQLQNLLNEIRKTPPQIKEEDLRGPLWPCYPKPSNEQMEEPVNTQVDSKILDHVWSHLTTSPSNFNLHPKVKRLIEQRKKMIDSGKVDWALAELAAYGTLCMEGFSVRMSGQDCKRGTFSHRHAVYVDTKTGKELIPLTRLSENQGEFCIYNSPLSEMAVLGFEYGNSCLDHSTLTLWEAQFGDFSNGAQVIMDQYLSSGEEKWLQTCPLTLLLPHGYEGQGPEHSSARLERYLQLCAQNNMQVCYPTTPSNFFHVLRRQLKREFFKPLILMTPKSLLRHPAMISEKESLEKGSFQEVIAHEPHDPQKIQSLMLCSGKIYFELLERQKTDHNLLVRLEQIYPFPEAGLAPYLSGLKNLKKIIWVQEEPENMGAGWFVIPLLRKLLSQIGRPNIQIEYAGRIPQASPAVGSHQLFLKEQKKVIQDAFSKIHF